MCDWRSLGRDMPTAAERFATEFATPEDVFTFSRLPEEDRPLAIEAAKAMTGRSGEPATAEQLIDLRLKGESFIRRIRVMQSCCDYAKAAGWYIGPKTEILRAAR